MVNYKRLDLDDRRHIEDGLDKGMSFSSIAALIKRSVSSVADEVKSNRTLMKTKVAKVKCREADRCVKTGVCQICPTPGAVCARCESVYCLEVCAYHLEIAGCAKTTQAPWVCNGCRKKRYGCNRAGRYVYTAGVADKISQVRASESRRGINMSEKNFEQVLAIVRPALARRLSPYEIATLYADSLGVSESTLYRWIDKGYGEMKNIELERKVGFAPRRQHKPQKITRHGKARSYEAFCALPKEVQDSCTEMDTVLGKKGDKKSILTLYLRPSHFQLYLLLDEHTLAEVKKALDSLEEACGRHLFAQLFSVILTDNGTEFLDPVLLETSAIPVFGKRSSIYYCDPRQSQQKGRCEKNHSELRQMLPKGTSLDNLDIRQMADITETINSTPRRSLCGMSPLEMLYAAYGESVGCFLDYLGVNQLGADDIDLSPAVGYNDNELPF